MARDALKALPRSLLACETQAPRARNVAVPMSVLGSMADLPLSNGHTALPMLHYPEQLSWTQGVAENRHAKGGQDAAENSPAREALAPHHPENREGRHRPEAAEGEANGQRDVEESEVVHRRGQEGDQHHSNDDKSQARSPWRGSWYHAEPGFPGSVPVAWENGKTSLAERATDQQAVTEEDLLPTASRGAVLVGAVLSRLLLALESHCQGPCHCNDQADEAGLRDSLSEEHG
eukprot:CAMPEP_0170583304 /NCGR_PEP_ID=MMETSP0224-20130122/8059_1 /TAXON_ID=285029 /ORGANISM="Togula jolla, Strain CCCM 725" /LENGTH=232 /DNA_ID=CAMNT_0010906613 /DNA_START=50 /DNA_END=747 /DNA_ORIENTATION=-